MKKIFTSVPLFLFCFIGHLYAESCNICHQDITPSLLEHFYTTKHADLKCLDCHAAQSGDREGFVHNDAVIVEVPGRTYCNHCHIGY